MRKASASGTYRGKRPRQKERVARGRCLWGAMSLDILSPGDAWVRKYPWVRARVHKIESTHGAGTQNKSTHMYPQYPRSIYLWQCSGHPHTIAKNANVGCGTCMGTCQARLAGETPQWQTGIDTSVQVRVPTPQCWTAVLMRPLSGHSLLLCVTRACTECRVRWCHGIASRSCVRPSRAWRRAKCSARMWSLSCHKSRST